jgi:hypothetical protein
MITSGRKSVGTVATLIDSRSTMASFFMVHNDDNTDAVYIGDATVTTSNGLQLGKGERLDMVLHPLEELFAVATKTGHMISFLRQDQ